jgi:hypothetical protein
MDWSILLIFYKLAAAHNDKAESVKVGLAGEQVGKTLLPRTIKLRT